MQLASSPTNQFLDKNKEELLINGKCDSEKC